jgi:heme/copper-type cytochrome/quinol oxidase subunit 2
MNFIILSFCIVIAVWIVLMLLNIVFIFNWKNNRYPNKLSENYKIEWLIIIIPLVITYIFIMASIGSIYLLDQIHDWEIYLKLDWSQWKWYISLDNVNFKNIDSNNNIKINYNKIVDILDSINF